MKYKWLKSEKLISIKDMILAVMTAVYFSTFIRPLLPLSWPLPVETNLGVFVLKFIILFILFGLLVKSLVIKIKTRNTINRIKLHGKMVLADVLGVQKENGGIGSRDTRKYHYCYLECGYNGRIYRSRKIHMLAGLQLQNLLDTYHVRTIPLYVDVENTKKYYIDLESLNQYI